MASRTTPAIAPRAVAKGASRVSRGRMFVVVSHAPSVPGLISAPHPAAPSETSSLPAAEALLGTASLDDGLGAMRGLAAVLVAYFVVAAVALGGLFTWHLLH